jgi:hypothetical protein
MDADYEKELRAMAGALKRNEESDDEVFERVKASKYITDFKYDEDAPFYRVEYKLRKIILRINTAHPFFDALYKPLAQIAKRSADMRVAGGGDDDEIALDTELAKACADAVVTLELMLLSLARTQSEMTWNDPEGNTQRMLDKLRRQWSLNLMNQLNVH